MFKNFENFILSSKNNFPEEECTVQDKRELDVFWSPYIYMVLYIDIRFKDWKYITYARPYIYKNNNETLYGWGAENSSEVYGNLENTCQYYDEFVVGFMKVDDKYVNNDINTFNKYKEIIENQCN